MTLQELYERIGGSYDDAMQRIHKEALVGRFILLYLQDRSCQNLIDAWEAGDPQAIFDAAHAAKGVCENLSIKVLAGTAATITEAYRPGNEAKRDLTDNAALMEKFKTDCAMVRKEIEAYAAEQA